MTRLVDVCAGIVLYNPDTDRLQQVIRAISCQVRELFLVDNGSSNVGEVEDVVKSYGNVQVIKNSNNEGIARALNQICSYGKSEGYKWCLTLDHDTVCHEGMVSELYAHTNDEKIGILCPAVHYEGVKIKQKNLDTETTDVYACMTSGSLTRLSAWEEVGGFREGYFIDYVDNEFCKRLDLSGYRIVRVNGCVMHHQLGESTKIKIFGLFPRMVTMHSPWRYYYMTRNNLLFIWQYRKHLNLIREYGKIISILYHGILYSNKRKETALYIWRGVKDAFKKKEGIYQE